MRTCRSNWRRSILEVVIGGLLAVCVSSCASPVTTLFEEVLAIPDGKSIVYIYRPSEVTEPTSLPGATKVSYNGETLAWFPTGGYYPLLVEPGVIEVGTTFDTLKVNIRPGEKYFLRVREMVEHRLVNYISPVLPEEAMRGLMDCRLVQVEGR